ncbi:MAG TPA: DUF6789 family protein [Steroidobacteraceae bacterium]|nr:DUF6789 family protein [Steroidobacteraceae bacterium]
MHARSDSIRRGLLAGLVATTVVSLCMLLKQALGFMPHVNLVMDLAYALGYRDAASGWTAHYLIGVLAWGALFPFFDRLLRFPHWVNGVYFASIIWFGVMLLVMPAAGQGLFGSHLALGTPTVTLFLHWIYGAVLGQTYSLLQPAQWRTLRHWWQDHRLHRA